MTFREWLETQASRRDEVGDLARDAMVDARTAQEFRGWTTDTDLQDRLAYRGACQEARDALEIAIMDWRRNVAPKPAYNSTMLTPSGGSICLGPPAAPRRRGPPSPALKRQEGWVYLLQAGEHGCVKIGFTATKSLRRLHEISRGTAGTIYVHGVLPGTLYDEAMLHRRFDRYAITGEWFYPSADFAELLHEPGWIAGRDFVCDCDEDCS